MIKRKQNTLTGKTIKAKRKRKHENINHSGNGRDCLKPVHTISDNSPPKKVIDPLMELLDLLRMHPSIEGIKAIAQYVEEERGDYFNLGKVVRSIMHRTLNSEEDVLVKKLGANA